MQKISQLRDEPVFTDEGGHSKRRDLSQLKPEVLLQQTDYGGQKDSIHVSVLCIAHFSDFCQALRICLYYFCIMFDV